MANNQIALLAQAPVFETPFESQGKALQIRQMMNQGEVQDMDMQAKRQAMEEDSISRAAFSANPTDSKARLAALARAPKAYQAERKALQDAEKVSADIGQTKANTKKAEIEGAIKTMDAAGQALGFVMANPTMENAMSTLDYLGRNGIYSPEDLAHYKEVITKDPTQIKALAEQAFRGALAAKDQLAKIDTRNLGNRMETRSIDPVTGKDTMLGSQTIGQSPDSRASIGMQRERLNFDKQQAATGDDAPLDPLSIRTTAQQYLAGDSGALANIGRGAQGARNLVLVRNEIARMANAQGLGGADIAAKIAEFGGMKAGQRTLGTRTANIEVAATEAAELAPLAVEASSRVARSGLLPFGKVQIMFDTQTNDPNLRQFAMANTALANAYGQVMSRGGVATVSDKEHARELLATAFDHPSYVAAVDQLQAEIRAAQRAPGKVREEMRKETSGKGGHAKPSSDAKPSLDDIFGKK